MWLVCNSVVNGPAVNEQLDKYCAGNFLLSSTECHCIIDDFDFMKRAKQSLTHLLIEFKHLMI